MSLFGKIGGFAHRGLTALFPTGAAGAAALRSRSLSSVTSLSGLGKIGAAVGAAGILINALRSKGTAAGAGVPTGAIGAAGAAGFMVGRHRAGIGRFSGNPIPRGTHERIGKGGNILLAERHRGRGLTTRDLRGFRRTIGLLRSVGMVPKRLHVRHIRRKRGNPE
jgi:hypothetical protein